MPLLDHFHPPLSERRIWGAFRARWASAIADDLNEQGLPEHLFAEPTVQIGGQVRVDVATFDEGLAPAGHDAKATGTLAPVAQTSAPAWVMPAVFPDAFEVQVISTEGGPRLVAAIELVSPSNKDRPQTRRAFAVKCANYLCQGIPCIVMDVVTSRGANLHNEIMEVMQNADCRLSTQSVLYATAYRPVKRDARSEFDVWHATLEIDGALPTLPLFLSSDIWFPIDFDASYQETCERLRLAQ